MGMPQTACYEWVAMDALPRGFATLQRRMGSEAFARRMRMQASHWARLQHQGEGVLKLEQILPRDRLLALGLRLRGFGGRFEANLTRFRVVEQTWWLPRLPLAFDGFRLLQLSDLHLDLHPPLAQAVATATAAIPHDAAVVTGDYRNSTDDDSGPALTLMRRALAPLGYPRFGVLGNHDFVEMVWGLENAGLPILLNESASILRDDARLWIAGVDDPHFYRSHDFARARADVPANACCILLCHSPEVHAEAGAHGFDLMLSGHTHGGQICLPGGLHIVCPVRRLPRRFIAGCWLSGGLQGYTSRGTGACGVKARVNCPPEISVHILRNPQRARPA